MSVFNLSLKKLGGDYAKAIDDVDAGLAVSCFGMGVAERVLSACDLNGKVLYVAPDLVSANRVFELFSQVRGGEVGLLPALSDNLVFKQAQSQEMSIVRTKTLLGLAQGKIKIVVASADALFSLCPLPKDLLEANISLFVGEDIDLPKVVDALIRLGYKREALVGAPGQFSLRGDVLDIFSSGEKFPTRIELFDTQIEKMHSFDPETQRSIEEIEKTTLSCYSNLLLDKKEFEVLKSEISKQIELSENAQFRDILETVLLKTEQNDVDYSMNFCFPFVKSKLCTIFDYFDATDCFVVDECKMVYDSLVSTAKELESRTKELFDMGMYFNTKEKAFADVLYCLEKIKSMHCLAHLKVTTSNLFFETQKAYSFSTSPVVRYSHNLGELAKAMHIWFDNGFRVFVCAKDMKSAQSLERTLAGYDLFLDIKKYATLGDGSSAILPIEFSSGFILPKQNVVVLGTYDVFPRKSKTISRGRENAFSVPKVGDYVVHEIHGIGVCEGVTKLTGRFGTKDYIVVRYAGDDKLYVPIDQMDILDRFSGADTPKRLSKIGGADFSAVKEKVRKGIREMAIDLLALYAARESKKGFVFPADDMLQLEFENAFPYTETEDQLASIAEIKKDMQSPKVMDRLLCGDVGFGKTEVAFRACFKAVLASKQVAFLAPTTILSEQHYQTAKNRFLQFGVRIAVLNRFRTTKEKNQILKDLREGKIDIIFGTHRLLSKDVQFADLGLIVLDEEQKFGVEDKEKLKLLKNNVDVLTLSATPIPRTLHMSLSGIRDVSIISTPPHDRLPVQTFVTESTPATIKDAIVSELSRGGQVFYVYNRVESIYQQADKIRALVPQAKVVVGHGQLPANELEQVIYSFTKGDADVLICTTIIENGIDISNANTLIVEDADRFGLSQLYQIRGRVGRSNRMGYAYFLYKREKVLTEEAYKRLDAISEFTEFGSGFKVAMRDLEIRGSGNVLGSEQHGHMQKVGYDLYCKILASEVAKLKGEEEKMNREVQMKVDLNAFIPEGYIEDSESRMTIYKKISHINSEADKQKIEQELVDVFGKVPQETKNLLEIAYLKSLARLQEIVEVEVGKQGVRFVFDKGSQKLLSEEIANAVFAYREIASLDMGPNSAIKLNTAGKTSAEAFKIAKDFLFVAKNFKK